MKRNRVCLVCGKNYEYCPNCAQDKHKPKYLFAFCSKNCKDLEEILTQFEMGKITNEEADEATKNILKEVTVSEKRKDIFRSLNKLNVNKKEFSTIEKDNLDIVEDTKETESKIQNKNKKFKKVSE